MVHKLSYKISFPSSYHKSSSKKLIVIQLDTLFLCDIFFLFNAHVSFHLYLLKQSFLFRLPRHVNFSFHFYILKIFFGCSIHTVTNYIYIRVKRKDFQGSNILTSSKIVPNKLFMLCYREGCVVRKIDRAFNAKGWRETMANTLAAWNFPPRRLMPLSLHSMQHL